MVPINDIQAQVKALDAKMAELTQLANTFNAERQALKASMDTWGGVMGNHAENGYIEADELIVGNKFPA